jgi:hypothetical protein
VTGGDLLVAVALGASGGAHEVLCAPGLVGLDLRSLREQADRFVQRADALGTLRAAAWFAVVLIAWLCVCFAIASIALRACTIDRSGAAAPAVAANTSVGSIPASSSASQCLRPTLILGQHTSCPEQRQRARCQ